MPRRHTIGTRGPIGKRDEERVRRNKTDESGQTTRKITSIGIPRIPELGDVSFNGQTHPIIDEMYESIRNSAAVKFYEATDWQYARLTLLALNEELIASKAWGKPMGAMKLTAINQMMSNLLLTEGDRRRARIEIERSPGEVEGEGAKVSDLFRQRFETAG